MEGGRGIPESNNTTTIDFGSPSGPHFNARAFEDEMGSPAINNPNDFTTLKIEDLDEGRGRGKVATPGGANKPGYDNYNPVWKLQITDDKNTVKYEGKFVDRNGENRQ